MIADTLKRLRAEKGVTQEIAAEKIGISVRTLAGYERGERIPRGEILDAVADYYGVSREQLLAEALSENDNAAAIAKKKRSGARTVIIIACVAAALLILDTVFFIVENRPVENGDSVLGILADWRNIAMALLVLLLAAAGISGLAVSLRRRSGLPVKIFAVLLALSVAGMVASCTVFALLSSDAFFGEERRGFVTYLRVDLQGDYNGNVTARATNNFNLGFDTVQVRLSLYFSENFTENTDEMTVAGTSVSDDLDIYKNIEIVAQTVVFGYWKAHVVYKTNGNGWHELQTKTLTFNEKGIKQD